MGELSGKNLFDGITINGEPIQSTSGWHIEPVPYFTEPTPYIKDTPSAELIRQIDNMSEKELKERLFEKEENRKEDKNMEDILAIYENRKRKEIFEEYEKKEKEILSNDKFAKLLEEYREKVVELYKKEFNEEEYPGPECMAFFKEKATEVKLEKLDEDKSKKIRELNKMLEEVRAQAKLIKEDDLSSYEHIRELLVNYGILDNKYRINA